MRNILYTLKIFNNTLFSKAHKRICKTLCCLSKKCKAQKQMEYFLLSEALKCKDSRTNECMNVYIMNVYVSPKLKGRTAV